MTKILLIRHAATDAVGKKLSGRMPGVHLNDEGLMQAQVLAKRLEELTIDFIYSSPLERAVETATPIAISRNSEIITSTDFLEINFGEWTNKSFEELKNNSIFQLFNSFRSSTPIPGGESIIEAQTRMITGLQRLTSQHQNVTIAVISHSDMIKATIAYYAGIHIDMMQRIEISPASVSVIEIYEEISRIILVNHTGNINL